MEVDAAIDSAAQSVGLEALEPTQGEAIRTLASGHIVFVHAALPTSHGRSFCFILLPLLFNCTLGYSASVVSCVSLLTSLSTED